MLKEPLSEHEISKIKSSAARKAAGRFHGYVELADVLQEAELALLASPHKTAEWVATGDGTRLYRHVFKACMLYGHKEKAAAIGYRMEDLFFYSKRLLRDMIPAILEAWSGADGFEWEYPDRTAWVDISEAIAGLSEADYQLIVWAFQGDPEEEDGYALVAAKLAVTRDAARQRVNRVLRRMQDALGGEDPTPRRGKRSNSAALAETRSAWDGEG